MGGFLSVPVTQEAMKTAEAMRQETATPLKVVSFKPEQEERYWPPAGGPETRHNKHEDTTTVFPSSYASRTNANAKMQKVMRASGR